MYYSNVVQQCLVYSKFLHLHCGGMIRRSSIGPSMPHLLKRKLLALGTFLSFSFPLSWNTENQRSTKEDCGEHWANQTDLGLTVILVKEAGPPTWTCLTLSWKGNKFPSQVSCCMLLTIFVVADCTLSFQWIQMILFPDGLPTWHWLWTCAVLMGHGESWVLILLWLNYLQFQWIPHMPLHPSLLLYHENMEDVSKPCTWRGLSAQIVQTVHLVYSKFRTKDCISLRNSKNAKAWILLLLVFKIHPEFL